MGRPRAVSLEGLIKILVLIVNEIKGKSKIIAQIEKTLEGCEPKRNFSVWVHRGELLPRREPEPTCRQCTVIQIAPSTILVAHTHTYTQERELEVHLGDTKKKLQSISRLSLVLETSNVIFPTNFKI